MELEKSTEMEVLHERCQKKVLIKQLNDLKNRHSHLRIPEVSLDTDLKALKALLKISKKNAEQEDFSFELREFLLELYLVFRSNL